MNNVITSIFGDETILLDCDAGECLHKSEVPGYKRPVKTINKPLIAGVIAGCSLFIVAVVLGLWWVSRRANQRRGEIYLSDDDDEALRILAEHKPAALHFSDVSYALNGKKILEGVRGSVSPGQVMAIMGPSGAGKTTFLDILARKNKRGNVSGQFFVNGAKVSDEEYKEISGFVDQEDTMMPTLTVYETILNSALLRLPRDMTFDAKNKRVMDVMGQLGIMSIKDQLIGTSEDNGIRGVSGGEKRRVSIACELVTSPSILFLDEPTSGLDSYNAYNVVECLVNLAKNYRRTVIFTIHQPKSNIVALFDQLILLAKGRCVYSGPFDRCQEYFDKQGYPCPPGFNIADYLVDLTVHAEKRRAFPVDDNTFLDGEASSSRAQDGPSRPRPRKRGSSIRDKQAQQLFSRKRSNVSLGPGISEDGVMLSDDLEPRRRSLEESETDAFLPPSARDDMTDLDVLIESYKISSIAKEIQDEIDSANSPNANGAIGNGHIGLAGDGKGFKRVGWLGQFRILSARTWKNLYRNPQLMLAHYAIAIVLAVLCGYLFFGIKDDISGFQNRMGLFFFILALFGFSTLSSLTLFAQERTLFLRERANGYYSPITYFTSKVLFDIIPLRIIPPIIMGTILYPMVGLVAQWPEFFKFLLVLVLFNLAASAICLFIGIVIKDNGVGNLVGSLVMLFSLLFAGLLLNHNSIPKGAVWAQNLSIFHFGFEALIVNEVRYLTLVEHK
jgi:ABC-type multidrug transport system ATPase subunit